MEGDLQTALRIIEDAAVRATRESQAAANQVRPHYDALCSQMDRIFRRTLMLFFGICCAHSHPDRQRPSQPTRDRPRGRDPLRIA